MGKSFNDDVFNNNFNLESINGLNISKEAIAENTKKKTPKINIDVSQYDLEEIKQQIKEEKKEKKDEDLDKLIQEQERIKEKTKEYEKKEKEPVKEKDTYIKKTMIFKKEYLDIIDGLATINDMQIKDVLNQLLDHAISDLDVKVKEKAIKTSKKTKPVKENKNIF